MYRLIAYIFMLKETLTHAQNKILALIKLKSILAYELPWGEYGDYNDYDDLSRYYDVDTY